MLAVEEGAARRFLTEWPQRIARPQAILIVSAHWQGREGPEVAATAHPETIHDFGGFPPVLYEMRYPAPGAPETAARAARLLRDAGFIVKENAERGLDHGAWVPLSLMYPEADIPAFQVSLIHGAGPEEHFRFGAALQSLREQGVLIIGSGSLTHNLYEFRGQGPDAAAQPWVTEFAEWIAETLAAGRIGDLMDYRQRAPFAARNHPTEEHLLPLFVALGAAGGSPRVERVHRSNTYGILAMDAYEFS
jgi:4,5-DOPA dioxygenase extradiol